MNTRQQQIQLLTRINRGKAAAPTFLMSLSEAIGQPIEASSLVPLPESDVLLELLRDGYQATVNRATFGYRRFFPRPEASLVFQLAHCLADRMLGECGFLLAKPNTDCGAVAIDISILLEHVGSVIDFDGDSLSAISADRTQGLLIDRNPGDYEQTYEVAIWGDRWSVLALACDPK